jgi:DNA-binding Lrp family transcriptional regulator
LAKRLNKEEKNLEAYILIDAEPGMIWEVAETTLKIRGVKKADPVAGQFDAVVYVDFVNMNALGEIIEKIQRLKGVRRTQTLIAIPPTIGK